MARPLALIMDNDKRRRSMLGRVLQDIHLDSRYATTLAKAQDRLSRERHQLVVLWLNGKYPKAYRFCRRVCRADSFLIVVTILPEVDLRAESELFDCGVAEVITAQQARPAILLKRIIARLGPSLDQLAQQHWIRLHTTWVNLARQEVWCNGQFRLMPEGVTALLRYILNRPQRVISRKELFYFHYKLWNRRVLAPEKGGKAIDMLVCHLRKLIEPDPQDPQIILSIHARGYVLAPDLQGSLKTTITRRFSRGLPSQNSRPRLGLGQEVVTVR